MLMKGNYPPFFLVLFISQLVTSCLVPDNHFSKLPNGIWRGILKLDSRPVSANPKGEPLPEKLNLTFDEVTDGELPFTFEIKYITEDSFIMVLINGSERIVATDIAFGRSKHLAKDTFRIDFPIYDTYLHGLYEENVMEGEWVINYRTTFNKIPFVAKFGQNHRFTHLKKEPAIDLSGSWETTFGLVDGEDPYPGIAELKQNGNDLTGTFLTETGDYRYLAGTVQTNKLYLSVFDGSHAFLFEGKINEDATIDGIFRSGKHYQTIWKAKRGGQNGLRNPDEITKMVSKDDFYFEFPDVTGQLVRLNQIKGKVKIVQLFGTWCPNCLDETKFLLEYIEKNKDKNITVVGLAFERYTEKEKVLPLLAAYKKRLNIPYQILWAGSYNKKEASKVLPLLNEITAFPTMLILDENNKVVKIHTGFNGPATSKFVSFKKDFEDSINKIIAHSTN
jgi:thiol-disulfide isomerase/thioredoxin